MKKIYQSFLMIVINLLWMENGWAEGIYQGSIYQNNAAEKLEKLNSMVSSNAYLVGIVFCLLAIMRGADISRLLKEKKTQSKYVKITVFGKILSMFIFLSIAGLAFWI